MASEKIEVDLEKMQVNCSFVFRNTGSAKNIEMGFPGKLKDDEGSDFSDDLDLSLSNFKSYVNDIEVLVAHEKGTQLADMDPLLPTQYDEWFTFKVSFQAEEVLTVRNTYDFVPSYDSIGEVFTGYVLQTGASWKDKIGTATVVFKLGTIKPYMLEMPQPGGFRFDGNDLIWERDQFEPSYDLKVIFNKYHASEEFLSGSSGEEVDKIRKRIQSFSEVDVLSKSKDMTSLLEYYHSAVQDKDFVLALYIKSLLPEGSTPEEKFNLGDIHVNEQNGAYLIS